MSVFPDRIIQKNSTDTEAEIIASISPGGPNEIRQGEIVIGLTLGQAVFYTRDSANSIVRIGASDFIDPMTQNGDIIIRKAGVTNRLGIGSPGQVLTVNGGLPSWEDPSGAPGDGAVDSVNGQIGDVILGIVDMDDFAYRTSAPSITWNTASESALVPSSGEYITQRISNDQETSFIKVSTTSSSFGYVKSRLTALELGDVVRFTFYTTIDGTFPLDYYTWEFEITAIEGLLNEGTSEEFFEFTCGNTIVWPQAVTDQLSVPNQEYQFGAMLMEFGGDTAFPLTEGQILAWSNVEQKWKPTDLGGIDSVKSVNNQTDIVTIGVEELSNVTPAYSPTSQFSYRFTGYVDDGNPIAPGEYQAIKQDESSTRSSIKVAWNDADGQPLPVNQDIQYEAGTKTDIWLSRDGGVNWIKRCSCSFYDNLLTNGGYNVTTWDFTGTYFWPTTGWEDILNGTGELLLAFDDPQAEVDKVDGDIIVWNEARQIWQTTSPSAARPSVRFEFTPADFGLSGSEWVVYGSGFDKNYDFELNSNPDIYVIRGQRYEFVSIFSSRRLRIQDIPNDRDAAIYTNGITGTYPSLDDQPFFWEVPMDAPSVLYYQSEQNDPMWGTIYVLDESGTSSAEGSVRGDGGDFDSGFVSVSFAFGVYGGGDFDIPSTDEPIEFETGSDGGDFD